MRLRLALLATLFLTCPPVMAQSFFDSIVPGQVVSQALYNMLPPELRAIVRVSGGNKNGLNSRGLAPTTLDSFVYQAGGRAEEIYGDEGVDGLPPIDGFYSNNRIDAGIFGTRSAGLTTGHGSVMPAAWGGDEYTGLEMVRTGDKSGNQTPMYIPSNILNATGIINSVTTSAGIGTERPGVSAPVAIIDSGTSYNQNAADFIRSYGQWATATVPYAVTPDMKPIQNTETGQLMGWMAPGESVSGFLSGSTGRLLPSQAAAASSMLSKLSSQQAGYVLPTSTSSTSAGF